MLWIKKSLFLKLAILIVVSSGIVLAIVMAVSNYKLRKQVTEEQKRYYSTLSAQAAREIDLKFFEAKTVVDKAVILFKAKEITRPAAIEIINSVVNSNPIIGGSAIALAPDSDFTGKGFKMLYSWYDNGTLKTADRISPEQDYKSEWFSKPFKQKREIWTDPYIDTDIDKMMVTYSAPVIVNGKVVAIITCDLILDTIDKILSTLKIAHEGSPILVTNAGRIILYPKKEWILKETLESISSKLKNEDDRKTMLKLSDNMKENKTGSFRFKSIYSESFVWLYFNTIFLPDWRIGFIIPEESILSPIYDLNRYMFLIALIGIIALLIPAFFVAHSITRPLKTLCSAADSIAVGNFETVLPRIKNADEIGRLVNDFDKMRIDLKEYIETLAATTAEKEKIAHELSIAREIQHGILPKLFPPFPTYPGLDIYATLESAKEVGGDLYDFALIDEDKLYIAIGDVSGKGIPASLFMAVGKTLLKSTIQTIKDPAKALSIVNNELSENNENCMFITLFCGILDLKTNRLVFSNAGHNPPVIIQQKESYFIQQALSPPVGAIPEIKYINETITLPEESLFLLYTDGVTEAMNADKELFGDKTLLNLLQKEKYHTAEKCINTVHESIKKFVDGTEQSDDITMLCLSNSKTILRQNNNFSASIIITNNRAELQRIITWLENINHELNWPAGFLTQLNLALEEWVVNIISHAFNDDNVHEIKIILSQTEETVELIVIDDGIEFDPTKQGNADTTSLIEDRNIGGLGIHFIKNNTDSFGYKREGGNNIIRMEKKVPY